MSVLMTATIHGDPDDLVDRYRRQQGLLYEEFGGSPPGYLAHACARTEGGLLITNIVESEKAVWDLRPRFARTADAVGLPEPDITIHELVNAVSKPIEPTAV